MSCEQVRGELSPMIPLWAANYSRRNRFLSNKLWKVPSVLFAQPVGLVACACWNSHATWGWQRSGFLLVILTVLMTFSIALPYFGVMVKQSMPAFLPFISQAGGSPPMTGVFAVPMILMGFTGVIPFILLYETINQRNVDDTKKIFTANSIALPIILICCLGCVVTVAYPIGYTQVPSKFEWIVTVLFEHSFGACMILFGTALYQFLLTRIWWLLPDTGKKARYIKLAFSFAYIILFFTSVKPLPTHLMEELGPEPFNIEMLKNETYDLPLVFTTSYKISAICEWAVCILSALNFLTLYKDLQRVSCHVILRHKSCLADTLEPAPSISLKILS